MHQQTDSPYRKKQAVVPVQYPRTNSPRSAVLSAVPYALTATTSTGKLMSSTTQVHAATTTPLPLVGGTPQKPPWHKSLRQDT